MSGRMFRIHMPGDDGTGAEFVVLSDPIGMIRLPHLPVGEYVLSLEGNDEWKVIDPEFPVEAGEFTMRTFATQEVEKR